MTLTKRLLSILALLVLAACGGGSSDDNANSPFNGSDGTGTGGGTGGGTGTGSPTITLALSSSTVTSSAPATVTATVRDANGTPLAGQVVTFSTNGGLGGFSVDSALTDANGVATVTVSPSSASAAGADSLIATTVVNGATITSSSGFQLTATDVTIDSFTSDLAPGASLSSFGQTTLTLQLNGAAAGTPVSVAVTSSCVTRNLATLTPTTATTTTGTATFTYRDNGCGASGSDTVQASIVGSSATASREILLVVPQVSSIAFVSATPDTIFLRGSGFTESATVTFSVRDAAGNGIAGKSVQLTPTTLAGGLTVDGQSSTDPITKPTDSNGNVIVQVNSGTVPTPVRILATTTTDDGTTISTVSSTLAIAVGLPAQLNFSLAQQARNIEGYDRDGTTNTYTVIASDRLGNPVPDGTAINFVTEGGQVQAIRQTVTSNGLSSATANFQTSSPKPVDGRVTVLAYALGEESFLDANGDNVYTPGEPFQDLGDPYLDRLYNGYFASATNQYFPQTPSGSAACQTQPAGQSQATLQLLATDVSIPIRPNTCDATYSRAYVRRAIETVFSTSTARPLYQSLPAGAAAPTATTPPNAPTVPPDANCASAAQVLIRENAGQNFPAYDSSGTALTKRYYAVGGNIVLFSQPNPGVLAFYASDANMFAFNPVAAGTTVTVSATDGLTVSLAGGSPVPSTIAPSGVAINYRFDTASSGAITVTFTSPSGLASSTTQSLSLLAPTAGYTTCPANP